MVDNQDPTKVQPEIFDSHPPIEESERRRVLMTNVTYRVSCRRAQISGAPPTKTDATMARHREHRLRRALKERKRKQETLPCERTRTEVRKTWEKRCRLASFLV